MTLTKTKTQILCALFAALIAIGAFLRVPVPLVPFTLQFLFTTLAGLLLGKKAGSAAVWLYVLLGLVGLPIFAEGGGISYIFKPTFGYLIGFGLGAYVTGFLTEQNTSYKQLLAANFAGLLVVYLCGMAYYAAISAFYLHNPIGLWPLFLYCFLLAVPGDIVLCIVAAILAKRLIPIFRYNPSETARLYGGTFLEKHVSSVILDYIEGMEKVMIRVLKDNGFHAPLPFRELVKLTDGVISTGNKMGEGWLLTAEMIELVRAGYENIVCAQPFGCLPNHICGKGMINKIRELYPQANITPIDYDPSATRVNQENRIKLMLAVARERLAEKTADQSARETPAPAESPQSAAEPQTVSV